MSGRGIARLTLVLVGAIVLAACGVAGADPASKPPAPTKAEIRAGESERQAAEATGTLKFFLALDENNRWAAMYDHELTLFYDAIKAAEAEAAQARAAGNTQKFSPPLSARGNVTGSCGGATNGADRFIGAESGGNPNARNPSGAWGCYQIMPGTWSSSCSDLGQHGSASTEAQAACASRLPSSSWAATGG